MKGVVADQVLRQVVQGVTNHLPPTVRTVRTKVGVAGGLQVWAVPASVPEDAEYGFWATTTSESGGSVSVSARGAWLPFGFGTLLPAPRRLRIKLEAISALEIIQEAVQRIDASWPTLEATVKARVEGLDVLVWFSGTSEQQLLPPIRLAFPR